MIAISVEQARNKLPQYLQLIEDRGESIQIIQHGKVVAVINNQESSNVLNKKQMFVNGLKQWRQKYNDVLNQISDEEIDSIFKREDDSEPVVRHFEDFE